MSIFLTGVVILTSNISFAEASVSKASKHISVENLDISKIDAFNPKVENQRFEEALLKEINESKPLTKETSASRASLLTEDSLLDKSNDYKYEFSVDFEDGSRVDYALERVSTRSSSLKHYKVSKRYWFRGSVVLHLNMNAWCTHSGRSVTIQNYEVYGSSLLGTFTQTDRILTRYAVSPVRAVAETYGVISSGIFSSSYKVQMYIDPAGIATAHTVY